MRTLIWGLAFLILSCNENSASSSHHNVPLSKENKVERLLNNLMDSQSEDIMVVAHRGDWRHAPENSLPAIQNTIDMGAAIVELDVRETKDGHLVLMHDATLNRTTTGKGLVSEWSLDSLQLLNLKNGVNHPTRHKIPTLEEAMLATKGKILVNLDKSYHIFDKIYKVLEETGTKNQVIMKGSVPLSQVQEDFGEYLDEVIFMPVIDFRKPNAEEIFNDYRENLKPVAYELVFDTQDLPVLGILDDIKAEGSRIWVNSLWKELNAGHDDDLAVKNTDSIYGWYIQKGINMIQTDRPELLINYLRKKGLHD